MPDNLGPCEACAKEARYTIELVRHPGREGHKPETRYYLPNDLVRDDRIGFNVIDEVAFCQDCIRAIEDNLRATILYLQAKAGRLT